MDFDLPIQILALMGLAFLLFLAGLEIDVARLRGKLIRLAGLGFLVTVVLGIAAGYAFDAAGIVKSPLLVGIALMATSLGLVVPVLKDAGQSETELGQLTIAGASVADFGAIVLLTFFFSGASSGPGVKLVLFGGFVALVAVSPRSRCPRLGRSMRLEACSSGCRTPPPRSGCASRCCSSWRSWRSPSGSAWRRSSARSSPGRS